MRNAVIVGYKRSPFTFARKGEMANIRPEDILSQTINQLLNEIQINKNDIEDIITGCAYPEGAQGNNIAKIVSFMTDMPEHVAGMTVNRWCGSSMQAIHDATGAIAINSGDVFLCCGVESMTFIPMNGLTYDPHPQLNKDNPNVYMSMGITAENVAKKFNISRVEQDDFAINSQKKTEDAIRSNRFKEELIKINQLGINLEKDEHPRKGLTKSDLEKLKTVFLKDGTVTPGNSSGINDGAAALLLTTLDEAKKKSIQPLAKIVSWASVGVEPALMGLGPIEAVRKAVTKAKWNLNDVDLFEVNEAFAAQSIAVIRELNIDKHKVNVNGGAIALGHPIGASGARILVTLIHELIKQEKNKGCATLCIGGGMGIALCIERI